MARTRYISNTRTGMAGSEVRGNVLYAPIGARLGIGGVGQDINTVSGTQRYELGTRLVTGDGRVFRYGKCGASFEDTKHGLKNNGILVTEKGTIFGACAAGATSVTVTFNGDYCDEIIAANALYGGYISIYNSSTIRDQRMIISNTAIVAAGGATTIGIDEPIVTAIASAVDCEILRNPYADLIVSNDLQTSVMGMPAALATTGQYLWIQTWGPCRITPTSAELGVNNDERMFHFDAYGGVRSAQASIVTQAKSEQIAGFVIERTDGVAGSAAPFIMLQISP